MRPDWDRISFEDARAYRKMHEKTQEIERWRRGGEEEAADRLDNDSNTNYY